MTNIIKKHDKSHWGGVKNYYNCTGILKKIAKRFVKLLTKIKFVKKMKNLNLENYGVVEMKQQEMVETSGGSIIAFVIGIAVGLIISDIASDGQLDGNWDNENVGSRGDA